MVTISTHGRKVYHRKGCIYVKKMNPEYRKEGVKLELRDKGYCACKYCNSMKYKYTSEKRLIDKFCKDNNLIYRMDGDAMLVQSEIASWKIQYNRKWEQFVLYHGNRCPDDALLPRMRKNQYHSQKDAKPSKTIMKYLMYIRKHDDFRSNQIDNVEKMPKKTKKQRAEYQKMKKKEKTYKTARVLQIMSKLEQNDQELIKCSICG